jgi:hypothetical protein
MPSFTHLNINLRCGRNCSTTVTPSWPFPESIVLSSASSQESLPLQRTVEANDGEVFECLVIKLKSELMRVPVLRKVFLNTSILHADREACFRHRGWMLFKRGKKYLLTGCDVSWIMGKPPAEASTDSL